MGLKNLTDVELLEVGCGLDGDCSCVRGIEIDRMIDKMGFPICDKDGKSIN